MECTRKIAIQETFDQLKETLATTMWRMNMTFYKMRLVIYILFLSYDTMGRYNRWIPWVNSMGQYHGSMPFSIQINPSPLGTNGPHCVKFPLGNPLLNMQISLGLWMTQNQVLLTIRVLHG